MAEYREKERDILEKESRKKELKRDSMPNVYF